jgi:hypothetical protein
MRVVVVSNARALTEPVKSCRADQDDYESVLVVLQMGGACSCISLSSLSSTRAHRDMRHQAAIQGG